jgi:molybdate/tungstate transport system substrate-binding protein
MKLCYLFFLMLVIVQSGCSGMATGWASVRTPPASLTRAPGPTGTPQAEPIDRTPLKVLFAGSLIIPFDGVERAFEAAHPEVDVLMEGHGSIQVIRHITELDDLTDVAVLADYALVPAMMYEKLIPETGEPYSEWIIQFASGEMVLAYTPDSAYAREINVDNWYQIIARDDVRFALSDPRFDACGYRALMVLQLAETYYDRITILENMVMGRFTYPIQTEIGDERMIIHVPELLQPKKNSSLLVRSYSVQLIALLQSGDADYAFEYETVARQHGLSFVKLPAEINLGDPARAASYKQVEVELDFQRYATVRPRFTGEMITYGITIPGNAPNPKLAEAFVAFLLGPEGQAAMEAGGHTIFETFQTDAFDKLPAALRPLCQPLTGE